MNSQVNTTAKVAAAMELEDYVEITNFNRAELDILVRNFKSLNPTISPTGIERVDRQHFRDLLSSQFGVTESLLMDRVFRVFDQDVDNHIGFDEFIKGMSIFLKGKVEEKLKFCFKVYDLNSDRYITKEEMFQMLQHCLVKGADEDEDGVKDLVDMVLKKLDEDRDGRVSEQDYNSAVSKDILLLETFGQVLPSLKDIDAYLCVERSDEDEKNIKSANPKGMVGHGSVGHGTPRSANSTQSAHKKTSKPAI